MTSFIADDTVTYFDGGANFDGIDYTESDAGLRLICPGFRMRMGMLPCLAAMRKGIK